MPAEKLGADHEQEAAYQLVAVSDLKIGDVLKDRGKIISITDSKLSSSWVVIHHTGGMMSVNRGAHVWAIPAKA